METNLFKLIEQAKAHDEFAVSQLYELTQQPIYSAIQRLLKNQDNAQDIMQEAYITAFTHLDKLQNAEKFQSWLYRIAMNLCKDYFKKKKPKLITDLESENGNEFEVDFEDDRATFNPEQQADYKDTIEIFDRMFDHLPEDQRLCIVMYYRDELSVSEIADALNVSEGTIKSRLNYGRKKLRSQVDAMEKEGVKLYGAMPFLAWMLSTQTA